MKLPCLAWSALFALSAFAADNDVFPYPIHKGSLDNGLQVLSVPFDSPGIVSFFMVVRVGSREEVEKGVTGFAHFFEHVMFRGTDRFSAQEYDQTLQKMAAAGNANTWYDRTLYYFTGNASYLETMFDIEADRFQNLNYKEHDFKTEAGAVLGEYTKNFANPFRQYFEKLQEVAFSKHTYAHTTMGFLDDIKDMPNQYEYSLKFYDRFYRPEYCTLMIVGDAKHERVMELAQKYFGKWKHGNYQPKIETEPPLGGARKAHVSFDGTSLVGVHYRGPAFSDTEKDKASLDLLLSLGFSSRSDLYRKLVQDEQKARSISTSEIDTRDPFLVGVQAELFDKEDTDYVLKEILATIQKLRNEKVDAEQLAQLKSRQRYSMAARLTTPQNVGARLANYIWLTGDPDSMNRYYAMMDTLTVDDLQAAARKYLVEDESIVMTLNEEEAR